MHVYVDSHLVPLTRELATEFREMQPANRERRWRASRDAWIRGLISRNEFFAPKWAFAWLGDKKIRLNGQHSSTVLASLTDNFPTKLKVCIDEFSCDTERDVAILFEQFDAAESVRNRDEIIAAHAGAEHSLDGIKEQKIRRCVDGVAWAIGLDAQRLNKYERASLTHTHQEFIVFASDFARDKHLSLVPVMSAIYRTYLICDATAHHFWSLVMNESHPSKDHPSRALSRWPREQRVADASKDQQARKSYTTVQVHERCIHQWNAFREGREVVKQVKGVTKKSGAVVSPV